MLNPRKLAIELAKGIKVRKAKVKTERAQEEQDLLIAVVADHAEQLAGLEQRMLILTDKAQKARDMAEHSVVTIQHAYGETPHTLHGEVLIPWQIGTETDHPFEIWATDEGFKALMAYQEDLHNQITSNG